MSAEKLSELEKAVIKIESTVSSLVEKMSDIASAVTTMSEGISKLAVTDTKVENLSDDVRHLGDSVRSLGSKTDNQVGELHTKINNHHENHDEPCETNTEKTRESFDSKLMKTIGFILLVVVFLFEYNNLSINKIEEDKSQVLLRIAKLESDVKLLKLEQKHAKELSEVKELLKKANGHRYHLAEEAKKDK